jgi:hypothetical protein
MRLLFLALVTPLGVAGRPLWRRMLALGSSARAHSYWRHRGDRITAADLRKAP